MLARACHGRVVPLGTWRRPRLRSVPDGIPFPTGSSQEAGQFSEAARPEKPLGQHVDLSRPRPVAEPPLLLAAVPS